MASASRAALIYCENAIRHIIQDCDAYMYNLTFDCATLYLLHPLPYYPRLSLRDAPEEGVGGWRGGRVRCSGSAVATLHKKRCVS